MTSRTLVRTLCLGWLVLLAVVQSASAQSTDATTDEVVSKAHARIRPFLEDLTNKQTTVEKAYDELLRGSPLSGKKQAIDALVLKSKELETRYGQFRAVERIDAKRIGSDVVLLKYLYKCDNFPVVWYFTYYRDQRPAAASATVSDTRTWTLVSIRFDTEIELLGL